jgi:hypothetical protein
MRILISAEEARNYESMGKYAFDNGRRGIWT